MRLVPVALALVCFAAMPVHAARTPSPRAISPRRVSAPTPVKPPRVVRPRATRRLDDAKRAQIAANLVSKSLEGWVKPGAKLSIRAAIVPFNGDVRNPITGQGPVEVFVQQTSAGKQGFFRRLLARFKPSTQQKFLVHIDAKGRGQILEHMSLAPQNRFARFISQKLAMTSVLVDFYKSKRAAEGLWTAVGGAGAMAVSPALAGALFTRFAMVLHEGVRSQHELRTKALDETVGWAQQAHTQSGQWPTLMESFRAYQGKVADQQDSARPLALGKFAEALSVRQL